MPSLAAYDKLVQEAALTLARIVGLERNLTNENFDKYPKQTGYNYKSHFVILWIELHG